MSEKGAEVSAEGEEKPAPRLSAGAQWERYGRYPFLLAKLIFFVLLAAAVIWTLTVLSAVAMPLFISVLIAYLLNPTVGRLEGKGVPRWLGILLILTGLVGFFTVFAIFLYPTVASQVGRVAERMPQALQMIETRTIPWLGETFDLQVPQTVSEAMEEYGEQIQNAVPMVVERAVTWGQDAVTRAGAIVMSLVNLVLIPIFTFYFLRDFDAGKKRLARFVPPWREAVVFDRIKRMDDAVGGWFRGQLQVSTILAVLYAIGLGIVYGVTGHDVQSGIVIGLLTGFLNVVPYVGFALGSILAAMVVLIDWTGWGAVIGVIIAFSVIQAAESYYLTPRIVGDKVGLNPVTVIIVLLIGGHLAGLLGVLLAVPIAGAIKVMIPDFIAWYRRSSIYTGEAVRPFSALATASAGGPSARAEAVVVDKQASPAVVDAAIAEVDGELEPKKEEKEEEKQEKKHEEKQSEKVRKNVSKKEPEPESEDEQVGADGKSQEEDDRP